MTRFTFVPARRTRPRLLFWEAIANFLKTRDFFVVTVPTAQWAAASLTRAAASFRPRTRGTTQCSTVSGGVGSGAAGGVGTGGVGAGGVGAGGAGGVTTIRCQDGKPSKATLLVMR